MPSKSRREGLSPARTFLDGTARRRQAYDRVRTAEGYIAIRGLAVLRRRCHRARVVEQALTGLRVGRAVSLFTGRATFCCQPDTSEAAFAIPTVNPYVISSRMLNQLLLC